MPRSDLFEGVWLDVFTEQDRDLETGWILDAVAFCERQSPPVQYFHVEPGTALDVEVLAERLRAKGWDPEGWREPEPGPVHPRFLRAFAPRSAPAGPPTHALVPRPSPSPGAPGAVEMVWVPIHEAPPGRWRTKHEPEQQQPPGEPK